MVRRLSIVAAATLSVIAKSISRGFEGEQEDLARLIARVLRQGIVNYPSEAQLTDFEHFEVITGVPAPVIQLVDDSEPPDGTPRY